MDQAGLSALETSPQRYEVFTRMAWRKYTDKRLSRVARIWPVPGELRDLRPSGCLLSLARRTSRSPDRWEENAQGGPGSSVREDAGTEGWLSVLVEAGSGPGDGLGNPAQGPPVAGGVSALQRAAQRALNRLLETQPGHTGAAKSHARPSPTSGSPVPLGGGDARRGAPWRPDQGPCGIALVISLPTGAGRTLRPGGVPC